MNVVVYQVFLEVSEGLDAFRKSFGGGNEGSNREFMISLRASQGGFRGVSRSF